MIGDKMKQLNRVTIISVLALVIAILSLYISYHNLEVTKLSPGKARYIKDVYKVNLENINDVLLSNEAVFTNNPIISDNSITFSIDLNNIETYGQFAFDINNSSSNDVKVKDIIISGNEYSDLVNVKVLGIHKGDTISKEAIYKNAKIQIMRNDGAQGELLSLNNIKVEFVFEKN